MAPSILTLLLFPLLSILGVYCLFVTGFKNGLFPLIAARIETLPHPTYPFSPSNEPLLMNYFGVPAIDHQLGTMVMFFAPVIGGNGGLGMDLFTLFGFAQFGGVWLVLMMEGLRAGNGGWAAASFVGTYGFFVQNISFAVSTPFYLFLHLLTSPIAKSPASTKDATGLLFVPSYDMSVLPLSLILGYVVPSVLMVVPGTAQIASPTHQRLVAFWQAFPLWTIIAQWFLKELCVAVYGPDAPKQSSAGYLKGARRVYVFVLGFCVVTTVPALALSLLPPQVVPESMPMLAMFADCSFSSVFLPPALYPISPITGLADGVRTFLIWDMYIGSVACLLWSIVLYRKALTETAGSGSSPAWSTIALKTAFWTMVSGPCGAFTIFLWERDEVMCQKVKQ